MSCSEPGMASRLQVLPPVRRVAELGSFCKPMKILMATTLVFFGALWSYYATLHATLMRSRALSDAMQMEASLKAWATNKVPESELLEIFPENYSLRFGGERKDRNFRKMIEDISIAGTVPLWPGLMSILVGLAGVVSAIRDKRNKSAEQARPPNP